jgi:hypothetical protein
LRQTVKDYILSLNFGYKKALRDKAVEYINAYASFVDPHTVEYTTVVRLCKARWGSMKILTVDSFVLHQATRSKPSEVKRASARHFLIAVGGRPKCTHVHTTVCNDVLLPRGIFFLMSRQTRLFLAPKSLASRRMIFFRLKRRLARRFALALAVCFI